MQDLHEIEQSQYVRRLFVYPMHERGQQGRPAMILPSPQPKFDPHHRAFDENDVDAMAVLLAELRTEQLMAAREGRVLESAEYAERAHRIADHLTRGH